MGRFSDWKYFIVLGTQRNAGGPPSGAANAHPEEKVAQAEQRKGRSTDAHYEALHGKVYDHREVSHHPEVLE